MADAVQEARARSVALKLIRGESVGAGDGDTFIPRTPTVQQLVDALLAFANPEGNAPTIGEGVPTGAENAQVRVVRCAYGHEAYFGGCEECPYTNFPAAQPRSPYSGDAREALIAGPVWQETGQEQECWTAEVQTFGGYSVVATVHGSSQADAIARQSAILAALSEHQGTADADWVLVPRQPTLAMLSAVDDQDDDKFVARGRAIDAWTAMLAASPASPPQGDRVAELEAEVARLRGLLVDPGDPAWEDARPVLVAELRKAHLHYAADRTAEAQPAEVPSWIALNLIAQAARTALSPQTQSSDEGKSV
jgi:hypothetical protein